MSRPYTRIALLQVAIIAGGVPIMMLGSPVPLLCILVILKIGMDVWLHARSHRAITSDNSEIRRDQKVEIGAMKNYKIRPKSRF